MPRTRHQANNTVQDLVTMLFDVHAMKHLLKKFDVDMCEMHLINAERISEGYRIIGEIYRVAQHPILNVSHLFQLTCAFNEELHHIFGDTEIIESMSSMRFYLNAIRCVWDTHQIDEWSRRVRENENNHQEQLLHSLRYRLVEVRHEQDSTRFNDITRTLDWSRPHFSSFSSSFSTLNVFQTICVGENDFDDNMTNRRFLIHKCHLMNVVPILRNGFQLPPDDIQAELFRFGKGLYFVDTIEEALHEEYTIDTNEEKLLLICEVALGDVTMYTSSDRRVRFEGLQSVEQEITKRYSRCSSNRDQRSHHPDQVDLVHHEYCVYDPSRVKLRYIVWIRVKPKQIDNGWSLRIHEK